MKFLGTQPKTLKIYYLDNRAQLKSVTSGKHLFNDISCWLLMRFIKAFVASLVHLGRFKSGHDFLLELELTPDKTTAVRARRIIFDCPCIVKYRPIQSENSKFTLSPGKSGRVLRPFISTLLTRDILVKMVTMKFG